MANIGTTIAPWMLFFQQSSVVDKALKEKDIKFGKVDTFIGAVLTVVVRGGADHRLWRTAQGAGSPMISARPMRPKPSCRRAG